MRQVEIGGPVFLVELHDSLQVRRAPGVLVGVVDRNLALRAGEADREPAGGAGAPEQQVGEGLPGAGAALPGEQDGRDLLSDPGDGKRAAGDENQDGGFTGRVHSLHQLLLAPRQPQEGAGVGFAAHRLALSHRQDDNIRLSGGGLRFS